MLASLRLVCVATQSNGFVTFFLAVALTDPAPLLILQPSPQNEDILIVPEMEFCQSKRMTIFLGAIYVYKGLLMVKFTDCTLFYWYKSVFVPLAGIRDLFGMGNETCFDSGAQ